MAYTIVFSIEKFCIILAMPVDTYITMVAEEIQISTSFLVAS